MSLQGCNSASGTICSVHSRKTAFARLNFAKVGTRYCGWAEESGSFDCALCAPLRMTSRLGESEKAGPSTSLHRSEFARDDAQTARLFLPSAAGTGEDPAQAVLSFALLVGRGRVEDLPLWPSTVSPEPLASKENGESTTCNPFISIHLPTRTFPASGSSPVESL